VSELETIVAKAFKLRGRSRLNRTELTFALAYELKWFTPEESKDVLDAALKQGLLKEAGDKLAPTFNVKSVNVPADFKPTAGVLTEKSLLDRLVDLLTTADIDRKTALEMVEKKQKEYGGLITPETAALIIAKEKKLNAEPYVDEAYGQLLGKKD
jgi:hypothetical protein